MSDMKALQREAWRITSRGEWLERRRAAVNSSQMGARGRHATDA